MENAKVQQVQLLNYSKSKSMDSRIGQRSQSKNKEDIRVLYIEKNVSTSNKEDTNSRNTDEVFHQKFVLPPIKKQRSETLKYNKRKIEAPNQNSASSEEIRLVDQIDKTKKWYANLQELRRSEQQELLDIKSNLYEAAKADDWKKIDLFNDLRKSTCQRIGQRQEQMRQILNRIIELQKQLHDLKNRL